MQTLRFDDRDWIEQQYVRDDNGRLIQREEYEARMELREALANYNTAPKNRRVRGVIQTALFGSIIWGAAALIGNLI